MDDGLNAFWIKLFLFSKKQAKPELSGKGITPPASRRRLGAAVALLPCPRVRLASHTVSLHAALCRGER